MNERIRELYVEATGKDWAYDFDPQVAEKFAELIVKECAKISEQSQWREAKGEYYEGFNEAMIYISNKITEHFGVEE